MRTRLEPDDGTTCFVPIVIVGSSTARASRYTVTFDNPSVKGSTAIGCAVTAARDRVEDRVEDAVHPRRWLRFSKPRSAVYRLR